MTPLCRRQAAGIFWVLAALVLAVPADAAGPVFWDFPESIPFSDCDLQGAALDAQGRLIPGLDAESVLADSSLVFWRAVAAPDGAVFVGSGHEGQVWRIDRNLEGRLFGQVEGPEIFSLLPWRGGVLVGCGPGGQVHELRDGESEQRALVPGGYVWAMDGLPDGPAYLATGSPAAVYRLGTNEGLTLLAELPARNALDLALTAAGDLLVTTQGPGFVFRVPVGGDADPELLLEIDQDEARQVLRGPDGWYVLGLDTSEEGGRNGRSNNGQSQAGPEFPFPGQFDMVVSPESELGPVRSALYRLPDDGGVPRRVWASDRELMIAAWSEAWGWMASGKRDEDRQATLMHLAPPSGAWPLAQWGGGDVIDLLVLPQDAVLACQAHPGQVTRLQAAAGRAVALSPPLDGGVPVDWARLQWRGQSNDSRIKLAVRTGNSATPDDLWGDWTNLSDDRDRDLDVPRRRFLQWKVAFTGRGRDGYVEAVTVSGTEPNLAPQVTVFELQPAGDLIMGGLMSANENATQRFPGGLKIEYNRPSQRDRGLPRDRAAALRPLRTFTWHVTDPNEDRLWFALHTRGEGETDWRTLGERLVDPVFTWDTAQVPDGRYEVRLTVTDRPENPAALALTDESMLPAFTVDNTPPELGELRLERTPEGFRLRIEARDTGTVLAGAQIELPDGDRERLDPRDGVCDTMVEAFETVLVFPREGSREAEVPWRVRIGVWDLAGNLATVQGTLAP